MAADEGWIRLGRAVQTERSSRWRRRRDFADACGLSLRIITQIERHERTNFTDETMQAVEVTLGWAPGSAARVRAGLPPRRIEDPDLARVRALWPKLSAEARRIIVAAVEAASARR